MRFSLRNSLSTYPLFYEIRARARLFPVESGRNKCFQFRMALARSRGSWSSDVWLKVHNTESIKHQIIFIDVSRPKGNYQRNPFTFAFSLVRSEEIEGSRIIRMKKMLGKSLILE